MHSIPPLAFAARINLPRWAFSLFAVLALSGAQRLSAESQRSDRPNILWISAEDHGPDLGCYGDTYASTPNLDAFAARSLRYDKASSNAPVCAPARTTIISGMYPTSLGAHHMRSKVPSPKYLTFFPNFLRDAGYYTTNNSKEDYNLLTEDTGWNESSPRAHWENRPNPNQPFFAVFNFVGTHESKIRNENPEPQHDPALAPLPPYHPDTPEVRKDWAQYYDRLSELDAYFQERLDELEVTGLAEDTIVIFWADHGSGMPRSKRSPGWSGLHVPLIVHIPEKYRDLAPNDYEPGGATERLVSFVDFAPTTLSLAGIESPDYYHGQAFLGQFSSDAPEHSFGFRGRMDERPDECRSVTDGRYLYIRNYLPHLPHGQYLTYQQETPTTRVWYQLFKDNELDAIQSAFWTPHPAEELFDLESDPHEIHNLAQDPAHAKQLRQLRKALHSHQKKTKDLYFIPEPILREAILAGESPATHFRSLPTPSFRELISKSYRLSSNIHPDLFETFDSIQTYWRTTSLLSSDSETFRKKFDQVREAMDNDSAIVAIAACEVVALNSPYQEDRNQAVNTLVTFSRFPDNEFILSIHALNALDHIRESGFPLPDSARSLTKEHPEIPNWGSSYRSSIIDRF